MLTTTLADGINPGLTKMAEFCPGTTYAKLSFLRAWGDAATSSSDGQWFNTGGRAHSAGHVNPRYGTGPRRIFYTHISDHYSPVSAKVVNVGVRDST